MPKTQPTNQTLIKSYERLFLLEGHIALKDAVEYILRQEKAKTLTEIAKRTSISGSTLTSYMNGDKKISKSFQDKLKHIYDVELVNPLTYEDDYFLDHDFLEALPPLDPKIYMKSFVYFRKMVHAQQKIIEGLKKTNVGLLKFNAVLFDIILQNEEGIVENTITTRKDSKK